MAARGAITARRTHASVVDAIGDGVRFSGAVWNVSSISASARAARSRVESMSLRKSDPRGGYARRRGRRLEVWGLLPDSRRIAHFLLPAVVSRAEHGLAASGLI